VTPGVVAAVLLAAVLHAAWNAVAHDIDDRLVGFTLLIVTESLGGAVLVLIAPAPDRSSWPMLAASAVLHTVYNLGLMRSYRLGEFGQVYPIARGTAPLLVALGAALFVGERLPAVRLVGVAVVCVGLGTLVFAGGVPSRSARPALLAAVLTGVVIASYTTVDGVGVRHAGTALGYIGWLFLVQAPILPLGALVVRGPRLLRDLRAHLVAGIVAGVFSLAAYGLVLWAQTRGALAPIAALRETSVIIGAIIGAVVFGERFGRWRIVAAALVSLGVVLINL
jgi:drug/metabolite transporter (DMT)-like permease